MEKTANRSCIWDPRLLRLAEQQGGTILEDTANLAWCAGPEPPRWFPRRKLAGLVADLEYGERMTALACGRLRHRFSETSPATVFLNRQIADELAHAELYKRYLERLGVSANVSQYLKEVFDRCLNWQGDPLGLVLAFHLVLESEAMRLQRFLADHLSCPLFSALNRRILVDEARHVAFGRLYGGPRLAGLERDVRLHMYHWIKSLWWDCAEQTRAGLTGPGGRLMRVLGPDLEDAWRQQHDLMLRLGLLKRQELNCI